MYRDNCALGWRWTSWPHKLGPGYTRRLARSMQMTQLYSTQYFRSLASVEYSNQEFIDLCIDSRTRTHPQVTRGFCPFQLPTPSGVCVDRTGDEWPRIQRFLGKTCTERGTSQVWFTAGKQIYDFFDSKRGEVGYH